MIRLDAATVLLQWSTGGLFFGWYTNRNRDIGPGYAKLLRLVYSTFAIAAVVCGVRYGIVLVREIAAGALALAALATYRNTSPHRDLIAPVLGAVGLFAAGIVAVNEAEALVPAGDEAPPQTVRTGVVDLAEGAGIEVGLHILTAALEAG